MMPRLNGLEAIIEIKRDNPDARILILTSFSEDVQIVAAIRAGAMGYVLKDASPDDLVHTIHSAYLGKLSLSPEMLELVMAEQAGSSPKPNVDTLLTEREVDVLRELVRGSTNQEIADALHVSATTVRSHISSILRKLQLNNRTQAALFAIDAGLVTPNE